MKSVVNRIELFYFLAMQATEPLPEPLPSPTPEQLRRDEAAKTLRDSTAAIVGQLRQANDDRNNLLHGPWTGLSVDELTYSKDRIMARDGKLKRIPLEGISVRLLKQELDYIISVNMRLADWVARFSRLLKKSC
jgi:hypothetical protein